MKLSTLLARMPLALSGQPEEAGLCMTSLPWPRETTFPVSLGGGGISGQLPLGRWPGEEEASPRRLLLFSDNDGLAPEKLLLDTPSSLSVSGPKPKAEMVLFAESDCEFYRWERHFLQISAFGRKIGMALGLKTAQGEIHWWEGCGLTVDESNPAFTAIEMGGSIPDRIMTPEEFRNQQGYTNRYLHWHNWLSGQIYARLHANGVCEIFAHQINNRFFDEGRDFEGVVPVIGFRVVEDEAQASPMVWDGSVTTLDIGGVRLDLREVARLGRPEQPGALWQEDDFLVIQPFSGAELYGGVCPSAQSGDPFVFHAEKPVFPRGMARTFRFSLSLSDRSPVIARYHAPAWWYGLCEELTTDSLLPVRNVLDADWEVARSWPLTYQVNGGFEDGSIPRHTSFAQPDVKGRTRQEPGWEGEIIYGQFLSAWRSGSAEEYALAMRSAYYFTDVCVDHAAKLVRMHGYPPNAYSLPMNRMQGTLAAFLETGDPYLYEAARAVTAHSHWQNLNSWPRMAVGRDACYVRSAVMLYRYFAEEFYREIAYQGAMAVVQTQREDGSFGDQGGGAGIHQWGAYISKPWMGLLALNGVLDYLELFPEEPVFRQAVRRFGDWLLSEQWARNGVRAWSYQHHYNGTRFYFNPTTGEEQKLPGDAVWYQESFARLLAYCAWTFDEPTYLAAWEEGRRHSQLELNDHGVAAMLQFIPWIQDRMWNARLDCGGVVSLTPRPVELDSLKSLKTGEVLTPEGWIDLSALTLQVASV